MSEEARCATCCLPLQEGACQSEFCTVLSEEDRAEFAKLKPGDYGFWPCSECGCIIDDQYTPGGWCTSCSPRRRIRLLSELLREALPHLPEALAERVTKLLGSS